MNYLILLGLGVAIILNGPKSISLEINGYQLETNIFQFGLFVVLPFITLCWIINLYFSVSRWAKEKNRVSALRSAIQYTNNYLIGSNKLPKIQVDKNRLEAHQVMSLYIIKLLTGQTVDKADLDIYFYNNDLVKIKQAIDMLADCNYDEAVVELEKLRKKFGLTKWIYTQLRICYIKMDKFDKLQELNLKSHPSYAEYYGPNGKHEGVIGMLEQKYNRTKDMKLKLSIMKEINSYNPPNQKYLLKYGKLLQNFGQIDNALKTFKTCWGRHCKLEAAREYLILLGTQKDPYSISKDLPEQDYLLTQLVLAKSALLSKTLDVAEAHSIQVLKQNTVLGNMLLLEIAKYKNSPIKLEETIHRIINMDIDL